MDGASPAAFPRAGWVRRAVALALDLGLAQEIGEVGKAFLVQPALRPLVTFLPGVVLFAYWAASERWLGPGTTPAKWALGLRVVDPNGERPGARAALVRALVMAAVFGFDAYAILGLVTGGRVPQSLQFLQAGLVLAYLADAVMVIASRRDSALLEDRWSRTSVVRRGTDPAAPTVAPGLPAPRHARAVLLGALGLALATGVLAAHGPGLSRLWRPADPKLDFVRGLEGWIAKRAGVLSDVTVSREVRWRSGTPRRRVFQADVAVPWAAYDDAHVQAVYTTVTDILHVDSRQYDRVEIRIGTSISGILHLRKSLQWEFAFDPVLRRWTPAPGDSAQ